MRYSVAVLAVAGIFLFRLATWPILENANPFLTLSFAVVISSLYGGLGPGLLATGLTTLLAFFLLDPPWTTHVNHGADLVSLGVYPVGGLLICWLAHGRDQAIQHWRSACAAEQHALRQLQQADRQKDDFLATLAHELRNPLAPILNALQTLKLERADELQQRRALEIMERQVRQMARLIEDLLDISRVRRGKLRIHKQPVPLAPIIADAIETSRPLIEQRRQELTVSIPDELITLDADAARLQQVLCNLLNNAAKYSDQGSHIWVTAEKMGNEAVLRVRDNGIGIPAQMLPHIFEAFAQVDSSLGRAQGGMGIGLSLVRSLVEMHGGTVRADSAGPGKGSEFTIRLPALPGPPPVVLSLVAGNLVGDDSDLIQAPKKLAASLPEISRAAAPSGDG